MRKLIITFLLLVNTINIASARKPAVEDFVGVEPEGVDFRNPANHKSFTPYNFTQAQAPVSSIPTNSYIFWVLFGMVATLPLMSWFVISRRSVSEGHQENVHHLKDYRKDDEDSDDISKAS